MKQRNGRMMVLAGVATCNLALGSMAALAGGGPSSTDVATTRSQPGVVAGALAAVVQQWADQATAASVAAAAPGATADAGAVVEAAAVGAPVTVTPPTSAVVEAAIAAAPTTSDADTEAAVVESAAAEPVVVPAEPVAPAAPAAPVEAEVAAVEAAPAPAASGSSAEAAIAAWFPDVYDQAIRVADCESSLNPNAVSRGGANHGLFQINNVHRENFEVITGQPWSMVYDPYYNSQYARRLYDASGWRPWGCRP